MFGESRKFAVGYLRLVHLIRDYVSLYTPIATEDHLDRFANMLSLDGDRLNYGLVGQFADYVKWVICGG
jgi:hypothetical protein